MFVPADTLPADTRIWIYQSPRAFSDAEKQSIHNTLSDFCSDWKAHGHPVKSSYEVRYDQFIILYADESHNEASGCSIDSSVRVIKQIATEVGADLFDRTLVAFLINGNITVARTSQLKDFFTNGMWDEETLTFNNLVQTKADLLNNWVIPAGTTWLKRYAAKAMKN